MTRMREQGFTLIELMIVVAIIALLAAIALPAYRQNQARAAESACQAEMAGYARMSVAEIATGTTTLAPAPRRACANADDATTTSTQVVGTPRRPGTRRTTCQMGSASCALDP